MRQLILVATCIAITFSCFSQEMTEAKKVERACLNYLEGFYEGDTLKLKQSLQPTLHKFGFMKNRDGNGYKQVDAMTFEAALAYAESVKEKKKFAKPDAPKKVVILDVGNTIAAAKVTAWWGIDYLLLSKQEQGWMIEQVLWEGPLAKNHLTGKQ